MPPSKRQPPIPTSSPLGRKGYECNYCGKILHNQSKYSTVIQMDCIALLENFQFLYGAFDSVIVYISPLRASPTKWSSTLKQFVGKLPTNCLSVFDHFMGLVRKGLEKILNLAHLRPKASVCDVEQILRNIDSKKSTVKIPPKLIKLSTKILSKP